MPIFLAAREKCSSSASTVADSRYFVSLRAMIRLPFCSTVPGMDAMPSIQIENPIVAFCFYLMHKPQTRLRGPRECSLINPENKQLNSRNWTANDAMRHRVTTVRWTSSRKKSKRTLPALSAFKWGRISTQPRGHECFQPQIPRIRNRFQPSNHCWIFMKPRWY
jgi:hypothetical protein